MRSTPLVSASKTVSVGNVTFGNDLPLSVIAGPCQLESRAHALEVASALKEIAARLNIGLVYKTSFDKANRTSATAARGIGLTQALPIFAEIRSSLGLPVLTDVHEPGQCAEVVVVPGGAAGLRRRRRRAGVRARRPTETTRRGAGRAARDGRAALERGRRTRRGVHRRPARR